MENLNQFEGVFTLLKRLFKYLENHLSLTVLIPASLGGVWQIIELSQISFAYIRFFSPSQVLSDGLLILILLISFSLTFYLMYIIHGKYINPDPKVDEVDNYVQKVTSPNYVKCAILFVVFIMLLVLQFYSLSEILKEPDSLWTILSIFPVCIIVSYFALGAWIFCNLSIVNTWFYRNVMRHTIGVWFIAILISFFMLVDSFRTAFALPKNLVNTDVIEYQIRKANPYSQPHIVYNNDKYIFIELNNFYYLRDTPVNGAIMIIPVEDILQLSKSQYKLPEHTEAGYHYLRKK